MADTTAVSAVANGRPDYELSISPIWPTALDPGVRKLPLFEHAASDTEPTVFPGIILFLTYWFPAEYRARMVRRFMAAIPISTVIGALVSG